MRIWNLKDARVYDGTPLQILQQMKLVERSDLQMSVEAYIEHKCHDAKHHWNVELDSSGATVEERAAALVESMVRRGLARRMG